MASHEGEEEEYYLDPDAVEMLHSLNELFEVVAELDINMKLNYSKNEKKRNDIKEDLSALVPDSKVLLFGSQVTGLATKKSDLDVYIDFEGDSYNKGLRYFKQCKFIHKLQRQMEKGHEFDVINTILETRVPIIRVRHVETKTRCDITFRSGLAVENTHLVKLYLDSDPRVRWLVVAVKYWMKINGLLGTTMFTSYATVWLVLFFLMRIEPPVICPVTTLQQDCQSHNVAGWDCRFHRNVVDIYEYFRTSNHDSNLVLLTSFFDFYSDVRYLLGVMCPLNGMMMDRELFRDSRLPREFKPYIDKINCMENAERFRIETPICLQDPFDLGHNITKGVCREDLFKFEALCSLSSEKCHKLLSKKPILPDLNVDIDYDYDSD